MYKESVLYLLQFNRIKKKEEALKEKFLFKYLLNSQIIDLLIFIRRLLFLDVDAPGQTYLA